MSLSLIYLPEGSSIMCPSPLRPLHLYFMARWLSDEQKQPLFAMQKRVREPGYVMPLHQTQLNASSISAQLSTKVQGYTQDLYGEIGLPVSRRHFYRLYRSAVEWYNTAVSIAQTINPRLQKFDLFAVWLGLVKQWKVTEDNFSSMRIMAQNDILNRVMNGGMNGGLDEAKTIVGEISNAIEINFKEETNEQRE